MPDPDPLRSDHPPLSRHTDGNTERTDEDDGAHRLWFTLLREEAIHPSIKRDRLSFPPFRLA